MDWRLAMRKSWKSNFEKSFETEEKIEEELNEIEGGYTPAASTANLVLLRSTTMFKVCGLQHKVDKSSAWLAFQVLDFTQLLTCTLDDILEKV